MMVILHIYKCMSTCIFFSLRVSVCVCDIYFQLGNSHNLRGRERGKYSVLLFIKSMTDMISVSFQYHLQNLAPATVNMVESFSLPQFDKKFNVDRALPSLSRLGFSAVN